MNVEYTINKHYKVENKSILYFVDHSDTTIIKHILTKCERYNFLFAQI